MSIGTLFTFVNLLKHIVNRNCKHQLRGYLFHINHVYTILILPYLFLNLNLLKILKVEKDYLNEIIYSICSSSIKKY